MIEPGADPMAAALDNPQAAPHLAQPGDDAPELGKFERPHFPPGSPVKPLGISSGIDGTQRCFYLNWNGQLVGLEANNRHGKLGLIALFGPASDWLEANFPQWSAPVYEGRGKDRAMVKQAEIVGFDQADAARALIEECTRQGVFDPSGRMRGRGAHRLSSAGGMVLHCGDKLLVSKLTLDNRINGWSWREVGLCERHVYTAAAPIPRPFHEAAGTDPGEKLLKLLRTWNWKRPLVDPRFLLGWIGAAFIGGWLEWRPNVWLTGGAGTGKSTLNGRNKVLHGLFGEGVFRTGNASAAAIRQSLQNSTVPVLFDEIEASADNRRVTEVIELARISSSGDNMHRGGADHNAREFTLASCFQFSSINIPPLQPQDRSRLGILELKPFAKDAEPPVLEDWNLAGLGRLIQRRMLDQLPRFEATKARYHGALSKVGHDARGCDQFGTLLACADMLLEDWEGGAPPDEEVNDWAARCRPDRMAEISEAIAEETGCLQHLTTTMAQSRGGDEREAIGTWIGKALAFAAAPLFNRDPDDRDNGTGRKLEQLGLKLVNPRWNAEERDVAGKVTKRGKWGSTGYMAGEPGYLAIAGQHQALAEIFKNTKWQGGVWKQSLARAAGSLEGVKVKFGHLSLTAVLVPLSAFVELEDLPAISHAAETAKWLAEQTEGAEV